MTIVVTGGGSGGHITPLLAVAAEIKKLEPKAKVIYIGQRGDSLGDVPAQHPSIDETYTVYAGKFRRYHGEGLKQLLDIPTVARNLADGFKVIAGMVQSFLLLNKIKPEVIFIKGGSVGVPVGLAAAAHRTPFITHDSDSIPGLANRIIARWATLHAVALPEEIYPYPRQKTVTVGVPISSKFKVLNNREVQAYKKQLGLDKYEQIILVTGGGNGARKLNEVVTANARHLLKRNRGLGIVHIAGRKLEQEVRDEYRNNLDNELINNVVVMGFTTELDKYVGTADIVIARGGATSFAELAAQAKACVIVPSRQLIWNIKNAEFLAEQGAIVELREEQAEQEQRLYHILQDLLNNPDRRRELGASLARFTHKDAARKLAELLIDQTRVGVR